VNNFARSLARDAGPHQPRLRFLCSLAVLAGLLLSLTIAAPAGAVVTTVEGTSVGLQPRNATSYLNGTNEVTHVGAEIKSTPLGGAGTFGNENGNAVLHGTTIYPIYWDPEDIFHLHHEWMTDINRFLQHLGAGSGGLETIFSTLGQYRDRTNTGAIYSTVFKGAYSDFAPYPAGVCTDPEPLEHGALTCLTDAQLRAQLQSFITTHGLPTGMNTLYEILTPPGVTVCVDATGSHCSDFAVSKVERENGERNSTSYKNSFCSYHGDINPDSAPEGDGKTVLYAAIPWTAGSLGSSFGFGPGAFYSQGFDCQDGGWNPAENKERPEVPAELNEAEQAIFEGKSGTQTEQEALQKRVRLEEPHQQEPNQEGKDEEGDFDAGLSDLIINQMAVEQANIVTDPLLNAWQDSQHREVTDVCRDTFGNTVGGGVGGSVAANSDTEAGTLSNESVGSGRYYINNVFNLGGDHCEAGVPLVPRFTAPNPVNAGEIVDFDGLESTVGLLEGKAFAASGPPVKTYATFTWNFGDGTILKGFAPDSPVCEAPWLSPCAGSISHSYTYGGTYPVTLTVTDVAGNAASVTEDVTVAGPAAPAASPAPAATPPVAGPSSKGSGSAPGKPVAAAVVASRSLKNVIAKGLLIHYSVNEQVAGHFEVLLSRSLARKLKIPGAPATGLPAGTPPMVVIAKALLVTTKGGHSTIDIKFSKLVAAKLKHARSAPLMVRLIVRNASSSSPATTTVLSSVKLVG
jgi:PKD domain/Phosphate-induced protein 1 conserved region